MKPPVLLGIYRERVFSPGKVREDAAVLDAALLKLSAMGFNTRTCGAESFDNSVQRPDIVLTMAQSDRVLSILHQWSKSGIRIINSVQSIRNCYRKLLVKKLAQSGLPFPAGYLVELGERAIEVGDIPGRLWLKRGDVHAIQEGDVASVESEERFAAALRHFRQIGVRDLLVQDHVEGPVVKFYGVGQQRFFRAYLETSGEEITSQAGSLCELAAQAASVLGLQVYGGDAVLTEEGGPVLIDFNDWPSFSRCSMSAGHAIAEHVRDCLESPIAVDPRAKAF